MAKTRALHTAASEEARLLRKKLIFAVAKRDCEAAEQVLLKHPQARKAETSYHMGVLSLAAAQGDVPMCQLLLEYSASISQQDVAGATPLIHAAARGATAAVQLLLDSKAGANLGRQWLLQQATTGGETALMAAAKGGHLDTVQLLCSAGAESAAATAQGQTALLLAAKHNRAAVVQHLAGVCGCSCSQADSSGTTALMAAAGAAARDVAVLLLQHRQQWGVQLAAEDAAADGAVVYAARGGDAAVLQALAQAGLPLTACWPGSSAARADRHAAAHSLPTQPIASISAPGGPATGKMWTLPGGAAAPAAVATAMQRLHSCSADAIAERPTPASHQMGSCERPVSPLSSPAARTCPIAAARVLPGMCLDGGDALMYVAAGAGSVGVVAWLLQQGVGCRCLVAQDRHSAVFAAVQQGQPGMVHYLVQQGATLEARDDKGRTPLAWAAAAGVNSMVRLLVQLGADLLATDAAGLVPRQLAHAKDQRATAELLTQMARDKLLLQHACEDCNSC